MRGKNDVIMLASLLFLPKSVAVSDKITTFALTDKSEFSVPIITASSKEIPGY